MNSGAAMVINWVLLGTSTLGFSVALAWNESVREVCHAVVPPKNQRAALRATLLYAAAITMLVVIIATLWNTCHRWVHRNISQADYDRMLAEKTKAAVKKPLVYLLRPNSLG